MRTIKCWSCGQIVQVTGQSALCPSCHKELKAASTLRDRVCRTCGAIFSGGPRAWYCPDCRAERTKKTNREYKARAKAGNARQIGSTDICQICGKEYTVTGGLQRYCPQCAPDAVREIDRAQSREWMAEHREEAAARKKEIAKKRRVCKVCQKVFYSAEPTVTCSSECAKVLKSYKQAMADHKRRGSPVPTLEAVAERLSKQSGVLGVSRSRNGKRWIAKYQNKYIGTFDTIDEAATAIETKRKEFQED